jgi:UDP-glucose 4-epimerase
MKILITGAEGRLGRYLSFEGHEMIKTDRDTLDITDYGRLKEFVQKERPEVIIHLASLLGNLCEENMGLARAVNVTATSNLLNLGLENGLKKFIFPSSCAVYYQEELYPTKEFENINPQSFYGETKLLAEEAIKGFEGTVIFRIFNIYGGRFETSLINKLLGKDKVLLFNPKEYYRDYIYYQDVVSLIEEAVQCSILPRKVFNVGSGITRTTEEILEYLKERGVSPTYEIREDKEQSISWADTTKLSKFFKKTPQTELVI